MWSGQDGEEQKEKVEEQKECGGYVNLLQKTQQMIKRDFSNSLMGKKAARMGQKKNPRIMFGHLKRVATHPHAHSLCSSPHDPKTIVIVAL